MTRKIYQSSNKIFTPLDNKGIAEACRELIKADKCFAAAFDLYGVPPLWDRPQGFATLIQIILEQQVSLASAKACFTKLSARLGDVTPDGFVTLDDTELRSIGFSRQKAAYSRNLAEQLLASSIDLKSLNNLSDDDVTSELIKLKGIGPWTAGIYLLMALLRPDIMPRGDIALHAAWQNLSGEPRPTSDEFIKIAEKWAPFRSTAARMLWHFYLSDKKH